MLLYMGFDDTDDKDAPIGTGRMTRMFARELGQGLHLRGILRHQLPRMEAIPFTSNNSSACAIIEVQDGAATARDLMDAAAAHLDKYAAPGSDPGLCVLEEDAVGRELVDYAVKTTNRIMTQSDALGVVQNGRLAGLGGTNDGIIGAAAAVGLTRYGWCGRFIEYGGLRDLAGPLTVGDVMACGIRVLSVDRDPLVPNPEDSLATDGWIRPSLMGAQPVLTVLSTGPAAWKTAHTKRNKRNKRNA